MANDCANDPVVPENRLIDGELDLLSAHLPDLLKLLAALEAAEDVE